MRSVTGLRELDSETVLVELDGAPWRPIPVTVAARAGLGLGKRVDRELARALAIELRRHRALTIAAGALARRPFSRSALESRLERRGVRADDREQALSTLERVGALDDCAFAQARACALAEKGYGDAAIRMMLEAEGIADALGERAIVELEPEQARAARLLARARDRRKALSQLQRRGFDPELVGELAGREVG